MRCIYCILLGHQDDVVSGEGEIIGTEPEMIGKRVCLECQPHALQLREEALGVPDRGNRMQRTVSQVRSGSSKAGIQQILKALTRELGEELGSAHARQLAIAMDKHRVDRAQAADRLAQWPGGKQPAVAETALAIDHCNLDVARQTIVLQPVVTDQHVAAGMGRESASAVCARSRPAKTGTPARFARSTDSSPARAGSLSGRTS